MHPLAGPDSQLSALRLDAEGTAQDDRVLVELRALPWLSPASWAPHVRNAQAAVARVRQSDVLVDELGWLARRGNSAWRFDQMRHDRQYRSGTYGLFGAAVADPRAGAPVYFVAPLTAAATL